MRIKFSFIILLAFCLLFRTAIASDKTTGSIYGDIRLEGKAPSKTAPAIVEYQGPCGTKRPTTTVELWKNRITDVTLWLTAKNVSAPVISEGGSVIIGQSCEFTPRMLPALPNSTVKVINNDPYTQWLLVEEDGLKKRQIMQEPEGRPIEFNVKSGKIIHFASGFYPWMEAWIRPEPELAAVAATEWDGRFFFKDIPPGEYILHAWHPSLGELSEDIVIAAGQKEKLELHYQMPEKIVPVIDATSLENFKSSDQDKKLDENPFKK